MPSLYPHRASPASGADAGPSRRARRRVRPLRFAPLLLAALLGCGSGAPRLAAPEGEGEWLVRRNPPACLLDQPALQFEARVGERWARVWIEGPGPGGEESALLLAETFAREPLAIRVVRGDLKRAQRTFSGGHPARVLAVETVLDAPTPEGALPSVAGLPADAVMGLPADPALGSPADPALGAPEDPVPADAAPEDAEPPEARR